MRAKHVVKEFSISPATLWRYVKDGRIKVTKVTAGVSVFDRDEIIAFFNGGAK